MIKRIVLSGIVLLLLGSNLLHSSEKALVRKNFGAMLELKDKVWVGAGQAGMTGFDGFENYWNTAPEGQKPNILSDYYDTWHMNKRWSLELKEELMKFHRQGYYVIPQIGINIFYLWQAYLDGSQDDELDNMIEGFKFLGIPVFLRIGYEFNNMPQNIEPKYTGEQFQEIFRVFTKKIREADLEIATVWNVSLSGLIQSDKIEQYYPGDEWVDWISFNAFTSDLCNGEHYLTIKVCEMADSGQKPVLIGEASQNWPLNTVNNLDGNYSDFCTPYFAMMKRRTNIKQTIYINWDWDIQDMIGGNGLFPWGDSRLQTAGEGYRSNFFKDISDPIYFHAASEAETRKNLIITQVTGDREAPSKVINLRREGELLKWDPVTEKGGSKFAHYTIYKDGKLWDYIIDPEYEIKYLSWGYSVDVTVTAMDRAGNESEVSAALRVGRNPGVEKIWDGEFDYPATSAAVDWRWMGSMDQDAKGPPDEITIDTTGKLSGKNSCFLHDYRLSGSSPENHWKKKPYNPQDWKIQLFQCFQVIKGGMYKISFKAVAEEARIIKLYFMDNHIKPDHTHLPSNGTVDPTWEDGKEWEYYKIWDVEIGTEAQDYVFEAVAPATETARLSFMMGNCEPTNMWLDKISVWESGVNPIINSNLKNNFNNMNLKVYSNSNRNMAKISYQIPKKSNVSINLFNNAGRLINSLVNTKQSQGNHTFHLNTDRLSSGVYYVTLNACGCVNVKHMMILR